MRWRSPPIRLRLDPREVHVWHASLDVGARDRVRLERTLSPEEHARAAGIRVPGGREHFVVARGVLRAILSRYLSMPSSALRFADGGHGKPVLAGPQGLQFNVSHSGPVALYAVSERAVGVDLERVRPGFDWREAARFLSPGEASALLALPERDRRLAFFECWTRKEAYLKARGTGLLAPLDGFDVSVGGDAELLGAPSWWLRDCHPAHGYVAAVAGEGRLGRLEGWRWQRDG